MLGLKKTSLDLSEKEGNLVMTTKSKNSLPDSSEDKDEDDPMVGLESKKPSLDSSDKVEVGEQGEQSDSLID